MIFVADGFISRQGTINDDIAIALRSLKPPLMTDIGSASAK